MKEAENRSEDSLQEQISKKLGSRQGETITEVLTASLIIALALIMLSNMIMSSFRIMERTDKQLKGYYLEKDRLDAFPQDVVETAISSVVADKAKTKPAGTQIDLTLNSQAEIKQVGGGTSAGQKGSVPYSGGSTFQVNKYSTETFSKFELGS